MFESILGRSCMIALVKVVLCSAVSAGDLLHMVNRW